MRSRRAGRLSRRRGLLLAVAALLTVSALIAVVILLFGTSGALEGRILRTTALLAGYGVVVLPATMLLDEGRGRVLAPAMFTLAAAGAALALAVNWMDDPPLTLGKAAGTVAVAAVAGAQISALLLLRRDSGQRIVRLPVRGLDDPGRGGHRDDRGHRLGRDRQRGLGPDPLGADRAGRPRRRPPADPGAGAPGRDRGPSADRDRLGRAPRSSSAAATSDQPSPRRSATWRPAGDGCAASRWSRARRPPRATPRSSRGRRAGRCEGRAVRPARGLTAASGSALSRPPGAGRSSARPPARRGGWRRRAAL